MKHKVVEIKESYTILEMVVAHVQVVFILGTYISDGATATREMFSLLFLTLFSC